MDPLDALASAVHEAHKRPDPLDALSEAVSSVFAAAAERDGGGQARCLALADVAARHRAWQATSAAKYGPAEAMMARLEARSGHGGLSARVWC